MEPLVEVVPNISEGRRNDVIEVLTAVVDGARDAWLLDHTSDADHNRSVITLAGTPDGAVAAMEALIGMAIERIDMRTHQGQHPRIGAVDVVPFVPLGGSSLRECVALAHRLGRSISERHGLPVYLYGAATSDAQGRPLAAIRRPGFEGLVEALARPDGAPDFGPVRPHPTAGAVAIGARGPLIAYNIQLATTDIAVARRIAARVREQGGGLARVQALGLYLPGEGRAQVSMNILDHVRTPLWRVWEEVARLAAAEGVPIADSELVGLAPAAALDAVADHLDVSLPPGRRTADEAPSDPASERRRSEAAAWLRLRDYSSARLLETRLATALGAARAAKVSHTA
ncbi:glutamate formimidoyltransferase [soil metagenome]